jgi:acetoin utilization protein AcuB
VATAVNLFRVHDLHILPVVHGDTVAGIISENDIRQETDIFSSSSTARTRDKTVLEKAVSEFMVTDVNTVFFDHTIEETAEIFFKNNISSVPVIDHHHRLVGVISHTDLFRAIVTFTGAGRRGILFAFNVSNRKGSLQELIDSIHNYGGRIASVFTTEELAPKDHCRAYFRLYGIDRFKLRILTEELKGKAPLVYMKDRHEIRTKYTQKQTV